MPRSWSYTLTNTPLHYSLARNSFSTHTSPTVFPKNHQHALAIAPRFFCQSVKLIQCMCVCVVSEAHRRAHIHTHEYPKSTSPQFLLRTSCWLMMLAFQIFAIKETFDFGKVETLFFCAKCHFFTQIHTFATLTTRVPTAVPLISGENTPRTRHQIRDKRKKNYLKTSSATH